MVDPNAGNCGPAPLDPHHVMGRDRGCAAEYIQASPVAMIEAIHGAADSIPKAAC
jgi:hypothetical protein